MSNFRSKAFNPASKRVEDAEYCDNYYGQHRYGIRFDDGCVHPEAQCGIDAVATQLDSLQARVKELEGLINEWEDHTGPYLLDRAEQAESRATRLQQELNTELQTLKDNGIGSHTEAVVLVVDLRRQLALAQQERDEAHERAAKEAGGFYNENPEDEYDDGFNRAAVMICAAIRRLAGPEKEKKE